MRNRRCHAVAGRHEESLGAGRQQRGRHQQEQCGVAVPHDCCCTLGGLWETVVSDVCGRVVLDFCLRWTADSIERDLGDTLNPIQSNRLVIVSYRSKQHTHSHAHGRATASSGQVSLRGSGPRGDNASASETPLLSCWLCLDPIVAGGQSKQPPRRHPTPRAPVSPNPAERGPAVVWARAGGAGGGGFRACALAASLVDPQLKTNPIKPKGPPSFGLVALTARTPDP